MSYGEEQTFAGSWKLSTCHLFLSYCIVHGGPLKHEQGHYRYLLYRAGYETEEELESMSVCLALWQQLARDFMSWLNDGDDEFCLAISDRRYVCWNKGEDHIYDMQLKQFVEQAPTPFRVLNLLYLHPSEFEHGKSIHPEASAQVPP